MSNPIDAVLFTDGGARPQPGYGGWGIYCLLLDEPKYYTVPNIKDSNCPIHKYEIAEGVYASNISIPKDWEEQEKPSSDTIIFYPAKEVYHLWGTVGSQVTSNRCELMAMIAALRHVKSLKLTNVRLLSDSSYVINGMLKIQEHNGLRINRPKTEVPNYDHWVVAAELYKDLFAADTELSFNWVKGHSISHGNAMADINATRGVAAASNELDIPFDIEDEKIRKQSENKVKGHGLLNNGFWYFIPNESSANNGYHFYATGDHGKPSNKEKEFDWVGKNRSASSIAVTAFEKPYLPLHVVKERHLKSTLNANAICIGRLNNMLSKDILSEIIRHGSKYIFKPFNASGLITHTGKPITQELHPPMLAHRLLERSSMMSGLLVSMMKDESPKDAIIVNITKDIYEEGAKNKLKLIPALMSGNPAVNINIDQLSSEVTLTVGIDLPPKNGLSRIVANEPDINLVLIPDSESVYHYYAYIKTNDGHSLVSAYTSNMLVVA